MKKTRTNRWPEILRTFILICTTLGIVGGAIVSFGKPVAHDYVENICKTEQETLCKEVGKTNKKIDKLSEDINKLVFFYMETIDRHKIEEAKDKWEQKQLFSE